MAAIQRPCHIRWLLAAAATLTVCASSPSLAQTGMSVGVAPSLVEFKSAPERAATEPLVVYNDGDVPIDVTAEIFDADLDTRGNVVFAKGPGRRAMWSAADWLELSEEGSMTIQPGEEVEVGLSADPPPGSEPGTHRAVVTFAAVDALGSPEGGVVPRLRVSTLVLVKVPGRIRSRPLLRLDVPIVSLTAPLLRVTLRNEGNVHLFAKGDVRISERGGKSRHEQELKTPQRGALVLPGASREFDARWNDAPLVGVFEAVAEVRAGDEPMTARRRLLVVQWPVLALPFALAGLAALTRGLSRRYAIVRRPRQVDGGSLESEPEDDLSVVDSHSACG